MLEDDARHPSPSSVSLVFWSHLGEEGRAARGRGRKKVRDQQETSADQLGKLQEVVHIGKAPDSFTGQEPMNPPSSPGGLLLLAQGLLAKSFLLQVLLFIHSTFQGLQYLLLSLLLLSVSSRYPCAASPTRTNSNSLFLVIYRSASCSINPSGAQRSGNRAAHLTAWDVPHGLRTCCLSHRRHPWLRLFLTSSVILFFFGIPSLCCGLSSPFS